MLCTEARLNARYFYEQFGRREDLLGAVYVRDSTQRIVEVRAAVEAATDPATRLQVVASAFVDAILTDERSARIVYFEMIGVSAALEEQRRLTRRGYVEMLAREAIRLPRLADRPASERRAIAIAVIGATDGLIVDWLTSEQRPPRSTITDTLLSLFGPAFNAGGVE